ncbi:MAG: four helix bundle protein [Firmicutes bacterium]|nr:four helix bundle protein [Bacillota bacterium]MCL2771553.1 four helix bundle protein [Bacillota bacterium]
MKESILLKASIEFSTKIINLVRKLKENKENIISNQIGRSGTSIGANIHEAQYGNSKADFISKLHIALKEANETKYWLVLLRNSNYITESEYKILENDCEKIKAMLIKSLNTAKENQK